MKKIISAILTIVLVLTTTITAFGSQSLDSELLNRGYPKNLINIMSDEEKQDLINDDCYYESSSLYKYGKDGELMGSETSEDNSITAFGSQSLNSELLNRGYPKNLINIMSDEEKQDLINDNCYYESSSLYKYGKDGELIGSETLEDNSITTYGQIDSSHLSIYITVSKSGSNKVVTFNYDWLFLPLNRYEDPICIGWNDSVFLYKSGSFKKVDQYRKILNGPIYTHSSQTTYAEANSNYVSWYADIKGYTALPEQLFGYGKFTLIPQKTGVTTNIYASYVHAKTALSLSVSFNGFGFSVSGNSFYDKMGTDISVRS